MLMMAPHLLKAWRKEERRAREARRGRLGKLRADALVDELVKVIRLAFEAGATGSLFGLEGPLRHGIRADLCLMGWRWRDADLMARELLNEAFRRARAVRPTWYEGQPEWTIQAGTLIERTRCVRCGNRLPDGHTRYCSRLCGDAHHHRIAELRKGSEDVVVKIATRNLT